MCVCMCVCNLCCSSHCQLSQMLPSDTIPCYNRCFVPRLGAQLKQPANTSKPPQSCLFIYFCRVEIRNTYLSITQAICVSIQCILNQSNQLLFLLVWSVLFYFCLFALRSICLCGQQITAACFRVCIYVCVYLVEAGYQWSHSFTHENK